MTKDMRIGLVLAGTVLGAFALGVLYQLKLTRHHSPVPSGFATGQGGGDPFVRAIQVLLNTMWSASPGDRFYLNPNGVLSAQTLAFIQSFQTSMNITADGSPTLETLMALQSVVADKLDMQARAAH